MRTLLKFVFGFLFIVSVVVGAVIIQFHAGDLHRKWDPQDARRHDEPIPVRTVSVKQRDVADIIGGTALTAPSATATISIYPKDDEIADRLVEVVHVEPGSEVQKNQTLIKFTDQMFAAALVQRRAALAKAKYVHDALAKLYEKRGVSELELREAELEVATAEYGVKLSEYELQACTIISPLDGVVESIHVFPGMRVTGATMLAVVQQLDPIHIQMDFPTERLDELRVGQHAEVVLDAFPSEQFSGTVIRIGTSADARTRVLPVTVEIPNPDNRIRAGVSGYVRIPVGREKATTIPQVAVIDKSDRAMVFCVENGRAKIREIETGPVMDSGEIEIVRGLAEGDEVVVYGHDSLRDNDVVNVNWKSWTNRPEPPKQ
jgi:membrane fusion protein (multidrug efflux system)